MKVIYTDAETAGVVQSAIDKQQLGDRLKVERHPYVPMGMIVVNDELHPWHMIAGSYAGLHLLDP